ncbi:MAG: SH3 domain-containing protein [Bacteroidota bacterium]
MKKLIITICILCSVLFCCVPKRAVVETRIEPAPAPIVAQPIQATTTIPGFLRCGPSVDSSIVVIVPMCEPITITGYVDYPFFKVSYKEYTGYMSTAFILYTPAVIALINKMPKQPVGLPIYPDNGVPNNCK